MENTDMSNGLNFSPVAVSINDTVRLLSLGRTKVYDLINDGTLKTTKVGRRTLVTMASIHALVGMSA